MFAGGGDEKQLIKIAWPYLSPIQYGPDTNRGNDDSCANLNHSVTSEYFCLL